MKKLFLFASALLMSASMMAETLTIANTDATYRPTPENGTFSTNVSKNNSESGIKLGSDGNYVQWVAGTTISAASFTGYINTSTTTGKNWGIQFTTDGGETWGDEQMLENDGNKTVHTYAVPDDFIPAGADGIRIVRRAGTSCYVASINLELGAQPTRFTVSYYDGETLLGTEKVDSAATPAKYTDFQSKTHSTFDGWYNEAALTTTADFTAAITADKAFYGKWTAQAFVASTSINIEQGVLDNGKGWDITAALDAAHIAYAHIDALDSLNSSKTNNNEPFLGLKLKTAGAFVEMGVPMGNTLRVKFGNLPGSIKVNGNEVAAADIAGGIYSYTATADEYVRIETTSGSTYVLKQINIGVATASANLTGIKVNGNAISGFNADSLNYVYALPYGTTEMPVITVTKEDENASVIIDEITSLTQNVSIVVVSGEENKTYTIQLSVAGAPKDLYEAVFSNGVKGAIFNDQVEVAYMGSVPSLVSDSVSDGATASLNVNTLTVTGADNTTKEYTVTFVELIAPAMSTDTVTFDGTENYIYAHYGWDASKGWKFAKAVNDASNMRITEGKTRIYMALPACAKLYLISGSAGARDVKIYINGALSEVTKTAKSGEAVTLDLNTETANFVAIESNQTGGDGGFTKMLLSNEVVTSLSNTESVKAQKIIVNGQMVIIRDGVMYNAQGAVVK